MKLHDDEESHTAKYETEKGEHKLATASQVLYGKDETLGFWRTGTKKKGREEVGNDKALVQTELTLSSRRLKGYFGHFSGSS